MSGRDRISLSVGGQCTDRMEDLRNQQIWVPKSLTVGGTTSKVTSNELN